MLPLISIRFGSRYMQAGNQISNSLDKKMASSLEAIFFIFYTCGKFLRMTFNIPKALDAPCTTQVSGLSTR